MILAIFFCSGPLSHTPIPSLKWHFPSQCASFLCPLIRASCCPGSFGGWKNSCKLALHQALTRVGSPRAAAPLPRNPPGPGKPGVFSSAQPRRSCFISVPSQGHGPKDNKQCCLLQIQTGAEKEPRGKASTETFLQVAIHSELTLKVSCTVEGISSKLWKFAKV